MFILVLLWCFIDLRACEIPTMTTIEQVEDVQECLSNHVELLNEHLKEFYIYSKSVNKQYEKLYEEGMLCKELTTMLTSSQMPKHCTKSYNERVQSFNQVSYQNKRLSKKIKKLTQQKIAIQLKKDLLESAYDLIIKRGKETLKLIDSMNETLRSIDKYTAIIEDMQRNKQKYVACVMLESLKEEIDKFDKSLKTSETKEASSSLMKLKKIYQRKQEEAPYCRAKNSSKIYLSP